jgi:hypothetical protein
MESYLQQFEGISLIKRDTNEIELACDLIKFTNLQNTFSDITKRSFVL